MAENIDPEKRQLTFAQREGKVPLPEVLLSGELTRKFRNSIWYYVERSIRQGEVTVGFDIPIAFINNNAGQYWKNYRLSYHIDVLDVPHDNATEMGPIGLRGWLKKVILKQETHEVLTVIEHMFRSTEMPEHLWDEIKSCFNYAPYIVDDSKQPICIISTTSEEMKENTKRALDNINQSKLTGAKTHLRKAARELREKNFADSIRESIHAVEATARQIDPKSSKTLGPALNSLEKNGILKHSALKDAFQKLYGYTNDEKGIRHPLIDKDVANVGFDEAIFMYVTCVSFVDYLVSKQGQLKK